MTDSPGRAGEILEIKRECNDQQRRHSNELQLVRVPTGQETGNDGEGGGAGGGGVQFNEFMKLSGGTATLKLPCRCCCYKMRKSLRCCYFRMQNGSSGGGGGVVDFL